ncbi:hypothetical protein GCM10023080_040250 [Streptomyces pseudoechinosporeus]
MLSPQLRLVADQKQDPGLDPLAQPIVPSGRTVRAGIVQSINWNRKPCSLGTGGPTGAARLRITALDLMGTSAVPLSITQSPSVPVDSATRRQGLATTARATWRCSCALTGGPERPEDLFRLSYATA